MKVIVSDKVSVAAVHRPSGTMILSPSFFELPSLSQAFIVAHELGHYQLNTADEFKADRYAFLVCANMGLPIASSIETMAKTLPGSNDQHVERVEKLLEFALKFDGTTNPEKNHNGSPQKRMEKIEYSRKGLIKEINAHLNNGDLHLADGAALELASTYPDDEAATLAANYLQRTADLRANSFDGEPVSAYGNIAGANLNNYDGDDNDETDDEEDIINGFLGIGKNKDKNTGKNPDGSFDLTTRKGRQAQKAADKQLKNTSKANSRVTKATAKQTLADKGIAGGVNVGDILSKVSETAQSIAGAGAGIIGGAAGEDTAPETNAPAPKKEDQKSIHWGWYVGGAVALIAIIVLVIWLVRRNKK